MDSPWLPYIFIVFLLACSAFFSGTEIAFASVNKLRLKKCAERGERCNASLACSIRDHYTEALCTILIGNNLVNIASSSVATVIALDLVGDAGVVYASAVMTVFILLFGEIMPKILAKQYCDTVVYYIAPVLKLLMILTNPIVKVVLLAMDAISARFGGKEQCDCVTADELSIIIDTAENESVIDEDHSDLLQSALEFGTTTVDEILTPRVDVNMLDVDSTPEEVLQAALTSTHSRLPVYEEDSDHIIGVLYLNHYFKRVADDVEVPLREQLYEPCFLHRSTPLPVALAELRKRSIYLAVIVDDYGGTCGIITMEDILEELVGEIWDEHDRVVEEFQILSRGCYRVSGSMNIYDMLEELELDERLYDGDSTTAAGWATERLGELPEAGDSFEFEGFTVTIEQTEDLRIASLILRLNQA